MKKIVWMGWALLSLCIAASVQAEALVGKVVAVADGDTITVLDAAQVEHKIRLNGIDAPEKAQPFGQQCKQLLADRVFGQEVRVAGSKVDRYRRLVGKVLIGDVDANLEQVKAGCAWHYKFFQGDQEPYDRALYANAENEARQAGRGLWVDPEPMPPWEWRLR
jgi:endonuclease YncB( thermonuclease family)